MEGTGKETEKKWQAPKMTGKENSEEDSKRKINAMDMERNEQEWKTQ